MKWHEAICKMVHAVERGEKTVEDFNNLVKDVIESPSDTNDMEIVTAAVLFAAYEVTYSDKDHMTALYRALHHGYIEHVLDALQKAPYSFPTTDDVRRWEDILAHN